MKITNPGDVYSLTDKGLDLIPIILNIVQWSAKYDQQSHARRRKDFLARLSKSPQKLSDEPRETVRSGGCMFPSET